MVTGVWHFSFTVKNLEKSLEFYRDILGFKLVRKQVQNNEYTSKLVNYENAHLKVAMLSIPNYDHGPSGHILELVEYVNPVGEKVDVQTCNVGSAHFAMIVQDIHKEFNRLRELDVKFKADEPIEVKEGRNKGGYTIYFLDPDGITLELFQPPN